MDDADYLEVCDLKWRAAGDPEHGVYACRTVYLGGGIANPKNKTFFLHKSLMGVSEGSVDHINRNTLDNRRENLRLATHQQNCCNRKKRAGVHSSRFIGVTWRGPRWKAQIQVAGRRTSIGYFLIEEDAARAYDEAAKRHYGDFANLNFP